MNDSPRTPPAPAAAEPVPTRERAPVLPPAPRAAWLSFASTDAGLDALVLLFALWTVCVHVTVLLRGSGWLLFGLFTAALPLAAGCVWWRRARARRLRAGASPEPAQPQPVLPAPETSARSIQPVGLVLAGLVLATWGYQHDGTLFWWASVAFFAVSAGWLLWRSPGPPTAADDGLAERVALFLLALFGGAVAACLNTPNSDDVLYVNIAVAVADSPAHELYASDTIHGGGMVLFAPYAVHSFELLAGFITRLTGIPAINVIQLIFGPLAGFLIAYAWARLLRLLEPSRWIWLVAFVIANFVLDGTSERSLVGHAFVRLFQGKAVLLSVQLPLLSAYAIEYVQRPSLRSWLLLAAGVIAGVGLSSTGLWLAPAVAGTALLVPLVWRAAYWKAFALGLLPCLYPVALGLRVRALLAAVDPISDPAAPAGPIPTVGEAYWSMLVNTFMHPRPTVVYMVCAVLAWPLARTALARRYLVAFSLIGLVFLLNPALYEFVSNYVAGHATHGRVLWYPPFTLAFAICVAAPIEARLAPRWRLVGAALACVLLVQFALRVPVRSAFALAPPTFPPQLKIYPDGFNVARFLARVLPPESIVLAPAGVSLALPMVQNHPYPLMTKPKFFAADSDGGHRFRMRRVIDGKTSALAGRQRTWFRNNLDSYKVNAVVIPTGVEPIPGLVDTLLELGFKRIRTMDGLRVWTRPLR